MPKNRPLAYLLSVALLALQLGLIYWLVGSFVPDPKLPGGRPTSSNNGPIEPQYSRVLATSDGGLTWTQVYSTSAITLYHLSCPTATDCLSLSDEDKLLTTSDGGTSWQERSTRVDGFMTALDCPQPARCYALAYNNDKSKQTPAARPYYKVDILGSSDGGQSWQTQFTIPGETISTDNLHCPTPEVCFVTGREGKLWATNNGGQSWSPQNSGVKNDLFTISCAGPLNCMVLGGQGVVITSGDGGQSWTNRSLPPGVKSLSLVSCPAPQTCYSLSRDGLNTQVWGTSDDGQTWQARGKLDKEFYRLLSCPAPGVCRLVSSTGQVQTTEDDGQTWHRQSVQDVEDLSVLACPTDKTCYILSQPYD